MGEETRQNSAEKTSAQAPFSNYLQHVVSIWTSLPISSYSATARERERENKLPFTEEQETSTTYTMFEPDLSLILLFEPYPVKCVYTLIIGSWLCLFSLSLPLSPSVSLSPLARLVLGAGCGRNTREAWWAGSVWGRAKVFAEHQITLERLRL